MQYLGGKSRIAKQVCAVLEPLRNGRAYREPFVGAGWVLQRMNGVRYASDACESLIRMYLALQAGWVPPDTLSEEEYQRLSKARDPTDPMTAFAGFGCSFGGKYFGGMARSGMRNYASNARNGLLKFAPRVQNVKFVCTDYILLSLPGNELIYCDPPYEGTTSYAGGGTFDSMSFWETMREWSVENSVVISEYKAPEDFRCIAEFQTNLDMRSKNGKEERTERLFMHRSIS